MKNVTILVNSCDKHESAWEPFFKLLKIQWPECAEYKFILNSETKTYNCDFLDVTTICSGTKLTWSERLKNVLRQIDTEYILYFLEDFFLQKRVSNETLLEAVDYIKNNEDVGYIGLKYNPKHNFKDETAVDLSKHFLNKDNIITMNRVNSMTALWRKDWLMSVLRDHETPWEFELYGSVRSRRYKQKVLVINNVNGVCPPVFAYEVDPKHGYAINGGKWLPKNKELFEKYGIEADFDILGIDYDLYNRANGRCEPKVKTSDEKFSLREKLYRIKRWFIRTIKKIRKTIRKIRSLI